MARLVEIPPTSATKISNRYFNSERLYRRRTLAMLILEASGSFLATFKAVLEVYRCRSWASLRSLGDCWGRLGRSWRRSWASWRRHGGLLGKTVAVLGVLEASDLGRHVETELVKTSPTLPKIAEVLKTKQK